MKKISSIIILIIISLSLFAGEVETFNPKYHYSESMIVCFSKESINNGIGNVNFNLKNGIVETPFEQLNQVFRQFKVNKINQLYKVKDTQWNRNGIYPMNIYRIEFQNIKDIQVLYNELYKLPIFNFVEFDPILKLSYIPNDPLLVSQWAIEKVDAFRAWNYETGIANTVIGIVDSGVKWNHPDLKDNIWINEPEMVGVTINWETGQIIGGDGIDNDGNGYIDDVFGWDFYATGDNEDNNPYQAFNGNDHGTHVAGCAAAAGDNAIGVVGPAYQAKIMVSKHQPSNYGTNYIYNGYDGVFYCADSGADIINCSWGGGGGAEIANTAASYAKDHGALMICAASNDNTDNTYWHYYPSDATDAVSVAATDINDVKASFSNYGTPIDVSAPGVSILSTVYTMDGYDSYTGYQGTSMASPVAAGVAALIKSMHPELTPMQLKDRLQAGCDSIDVQNPSLIGKLGAGRVNAYNSLMYDKLPNISLINHEIVEFEGNNDGTLNPGEQVIINLTLKNKQNWLNAENVILTLRSTNPLITVIDSVITIPQIDAGVIANTTLPFKISVDESFQVISNADLSIIVSANQSHPYQYFDTLKLSIPVTCMQANWPFYNPSDLNVFSPILEDLDNDGNPDVLFNDTQGNVFAYDLNKNPLNGFPVNLNQVTYAPLSILENGTNKEIVIAVSNKVYRISAQGEILSSFTTDGIIRVTPMICDQNNDGLMDIVIGTISRKIYSLKSDGITQNDNSPFTFSSAIVSPLALGKNSTIYVTTNDGYLHILSSNGQIDNDAPFPYFYEGVSFNGPVVISSNDNSDNEWVIISGNRVSNNKLSFISRFSDSSHFVNTSSSVIGGPIPVKINQSTSAFVFTTLDGLCNLYDINGNQLFSVNIEVSAEATPLNIDINNDGIEEIMVINKNGKVFFINLEGQILTEKTLTIPVYSRFTPCINSIDDDNSLDMFLSATSSVSYLNTSIPYYSSSWPSQRLNNQKTAMTYNFPLNNNDEVVNPMTKLTNYPNPFNPSTCISFSLENDTNVELTVFNIKGQLVKTIHNEYLKKGSHNFVWDGTNQSGNVMSSGIYFYQLKTDTHIMSNKMLLIK